MNIQQAWLNLSYACNNRCMWCYAKSRISDASEDHRKMTLDDGREALHFLKEIGVRECALVGGDPSVYEHLWDILGYANDIDLGISIVTNGRRFSDPQFLKRVASYRLAGVSVSIEGSRPSIHDKITRISGSFEETIAGLRMAKNVGIRISTITTLCASNIADAVNIAELLVQEGQENLAFNFCVPPDDTTGGEEFLNLSILHDIIDELSAFCKAKQIAVSFVTPFPKCRLSNAAFHDVKSGLIWFGSCHMFFGSGLIIDFDLTILPCTHLVNVHLGGLKDNAGHIRGANEFQQFWDSEIESVFRNKLWRYPCSACELCVEWEDCFGGCPLFWRFLNPEQELSALS
jgi:radical SAM protein with 4Fe4S-binding SPASM domain